MYVSTDFAVVGFLKSLFVRAGFSQPFPFAQTLERQVLLKNATVHINLSALGESEALSDMTHSDQQSVMISGVKFIGVWPAGSG